MPSGHGEQLSPPPVQSSLVRPWVLSAELALDLWCKVVGVGLSVFSTQGAPLQDKIFGEPKLVMVLTEGAPPATDPPNREEQALKLLGLSVKEAVPEVDDEVPLAPVEFGVLR